MTREEAIEHLKNMAEHSYPNEEYLMAIKALEQEPILDKIRAEIDELDVHYDNDYFSGNKDAMVKLNEVLEIINKYRRDKK